MRIPSPYHQARERNTPERTEREPQRLENGQALVEYALIALLVALALVAILAIVGPVVGNAFDNTLESFDPSPTDFDETSFNDLLTVVASYTPPVGDIGEDDEEEATNQAPVAVDDDCVTDMDTPVVCAVMANDSDPDNAPSPLSVVGADELGAGGGAVTISDATLGYISYTPPDAFFTGEDSFTYTISDGGISASATVTVTVIDTTIPTATWTPSPTPDDTAHTAPYTDGITDDTWWRDDPDLVFLGFADWEVEYWTWSGSLIDDVDAAMSLPPDCTATETYDELIAYWWADGGPTPGGDCSGSPWRTDNFAVRWTRSFGYDDQTTSDFDVELVTISNGGMRVYIDDTLVETISDWVMRDTTETLTTTYTLTAGVEHTLVIEYFELTGDATAVFQVRQDGFGASDDLGQCAWAISDERVRGDADAFALSDSPGMLYAADSRCEIRLRGSVDLAELDDPPQMSFFDQWSLNHYDEAQVQVRVYNPGDPTAPWYTETVHQSLTESLTGWTQQVLDLTNFDEQDFTGQAIEFRFVLEADVNTDVADGWWIDDILIAGDTTERYFPFEDNMEADDLYWLAEGNWTISDEYVRSGTGAWSDSPATLYPADSNSVLMLNGLLNLASEASTDPELVFYHRLDLGAGDSVYVEVSTDGNNWTAITPSGTGSPLYTSRVNHAFVRETISLAAYNGQELYLRFRLEADSSEEGDGWWIDDVIVNNRTSGTLSYPFSDDVESGSTDWLPDGWWSISPEIVHGGSNAWNDSPGTDYTHLAESHLQTRLPILMQDGVALQPELSFWHQRDVAANDGLYVEASTDGGLTWDVVWAYAYTANIGDNPDAPGTPYNAFNTQMAWEYVSIDMSAYIDIPFYLRFRLDALSDSQVGGGVWIDDISLAEYTQNPYTLPFTDTLDSTANWQAGGTWGVDLQESHDAGGSLTDNPIHPYVDSSWSVLELSEPIDLRNVTPGDFPIITWWDRFALARFDYARLQVSTWDGPGWNDWSGWTEIYQQFYTSTLSWNHRQADLRPFAGELIRIRFVVDALQHTDVDEGWWLDEISIDFYDPTVTAMVDFFETGSDTNAWILDGTWGLDSAVNHGDSLGTGAWDGYFYDLEEYGVCGGDTDAERAENAMLELEVNHGNNCNPSQSDPYTPYGGQAWPVSDIDFVCDATSSPNPDGTCNTVAWEDDHDHIAVRFARWVTLTESGIYNITLTHNDGVQFFVLNSDTDPRDTPDIDAWSVNNNTTAETHGTSMNLAAGTYYLELWYFEESGPAVLQLDFSLENGSFHDSPGGDAPPNGTPYEYLDNMSLTYDGVIDMTGASNPVLEWYDFHYLDTLDCVTVEFSLPYEANGFDQWIQLTQTCGTDQTEWTMHSLSLRDAIEAEFGYPAGTFDFTDVMLTMRFRLDNRIDTGADDGWWIDDIQIVESAP